MTMRLVLLLAICVSSRAYYQFVALNPNGANVPGVAAIGHVNPLGGGVNNDYGRDFDSAGKVWNTELCTKDSDGDGQSNGLELGDPCCLWKDGGPPPQYGTDISHPGLATSKTSRVYPDCASTPSPSPSSSPNSNNSSSFSPAPAPAPASDSSSTLPPLVTPLAAGGGALVALALLLFLAYFYCGSKTTSARQPKSVLVSPEFHVLAAESPS